MRRLLLAALVAWLTTAARAQAADPKNDDEKTLYSIGVLIAKQLEVFNLSPAEFTLVKRGLDDSMAGKKPLAEPEAYRQQIDQMGREGMKRASEKLASASGGLLEKAAAEKGAEKLPSGVVYLPLQAGSGAQPGPADVVTVHYTGTLADGRVFDSSLKRGQPATFPLDRVIRCWTEGVPKMKVGGKARLTCPSATAYGPAGSPPTIPPDSVLTFEVELLEVKAK